MAEKHPKRPRDLNQWAKRMTDIDFRSPLGIGVKLLTLMASDGGATANVNPVASLRPAPFLSAHFILN